MKPRGPITPLASLDEALGDAIERAVMAKHRRRLVSHGWGDAFAPAPGGFSAGGSPPRPGCELQVLIDGAECFAAMAEAIGGARESIHVAGWFITPGFDLVRGMEGESVLSLLAAAAERIDVRMLVWAGSPLPMFQPNRIQAKRTVAALTGATRIRCEADPHEHPLHCHHEKTLVIDGQVAFVGGIDMTDLKTDRFDSPAHPARGRTGWHDVAARMTGPAVTDVAAHFSLRWLELTGERLPVPVAPVATGEATVQVVRTIPEYMYPDLPRGDFSIFTSYTSAISDAQHLIYLENQFLWAPEITEALAEKLRHPPTEEFRMVILLPSKAHTGQDDTLGQLGILQSADVEHRLVVATLRAVTDGREDPLYIHAKVGVIDDRWLTVGSANLNAHSLFNDTEMNLVSDSPDLARDTRLRLWAEHLQVDPAELAGPSAAEIVDRHWRPITEDQLRRQRAGAAPTHRLLELSGASRRARRLLGPLNGLFDDG